MFQHRHYVAIANVLRSLDASTRTISAFSDMFQTDNPNFNRMRFSSMSILGHPWTKDERTLQKQNAWLDLDRGGH